jgi:hypothetical protein
MSSLYDKMSRTDKLMNALHTDPLIPDKLACNRTGPGIAGGFGFPPPYLCLGQGEPTTPTPSYVMSNLLLFTTTLFVLQVDQKDSACYIYVMVR